VVDKAIAHFKYGVSHDIFKSPVVQYSELAIAALEKTKPMLVNHERTFWTYRHYCPNCQDQLRIEALKYCENCGQRLDWSNYELGLKYVR
jgi:hypothetical protein